jgi:hypothetical protein
MHFRKRVDLSDPVTASPHRRPRRDAGPRRTTPSGEPKKVRAAEPSASVYLLLYRPAALLSRGTRRDYSSRAAHARIERR